MLMLTMLEAVEVYQDFFVAKLDGKDGAHTWSHRYGDSTIQLGIATVNAAGEQAAAGQFYLSLQLGSTEASELTDPYCDMFVATFDP